MDERSIVAFAKKALKDMGLDQENPSASSPSPIENKALLRSADAKGGEDEDQMMQAALPSISHGPAETSQKPISVRGWLMAIAVGLLLWALVFHLIG